MAKAEGQTNWKCDRCGRPRQTAAGNTPGGWGTVNLQPMGEPESAADEWDVCESCAGLVRRLLQPINAPDNRADTRQMIGSGPPLTERQLAAGYGVPPAMLTRAAREQE